MTNLSGKVVSSVLRPDGWAYLDWVTGVVRIDCRREEWESVRGRFISRDRAPVDALTESEVILLETVTHEATHYFQVCTTGYLYRVARKLFAVLSDTLPDNVKGIDDVPQSVINQAAGGLRAVKEAGLCAPGPRGLDVLSIVESAAFMIQKLYHYPDLTSEDYQRTLVGQPAEYRKGYDVACEYLGDDAFGTYPVLASLSLWTERPAESLVGLCEGVAAFTPDLRKRLQFGHLVHTLSRLPGFIGPPWSGAARRDFPEYEMSIRQLDRAGFDRQAYLLRPFLNEHLRILLDEAMPPVIFNEDDRGRVALQWPPSWQGISDDAKMIRAKMLLLLFSISTHIQRSDAGE